MVRHGGLVRRCIDLHARLGRMDHFLEYYRSNRRLQLNSDLLPPASFLDSYQDFIAQVLPPPLCCAPAMVGGVQLPSSHTGLYHRA